MAKWAPLFLLLGSAQERPVYETADADAAPIYLSIAAELKGIPDPLGEYVAGGPGEPGEIRKALRPFEKVLDRLHEAARARRCVWAYPDREKLGGPTPHIGAGIHAARLLAARTRLELETGDLDAAVRDICVAWRLGSDFLTDGPLVANLVGWIAIEIEHSVLQRSLPGRDFTPAQLSRLAAHVEAILPRLPTARKAMESEKTLALGAVDQAVTDLRGLVERLEGKPKGSADEKHAEVWTMVQDLLKADPEASRQLLRKRVEETWETVFHDADQPLYSTARGLDGEELKKRTTKGLTDYKLRGDKKAGLEAAADTYIVLVLPGLDHLRTAYARGRLTLQLHALWARLELQFKEKGRYPASAEELRFPVIDPWDGKPVKLRRVDEKGRVGFVLTSTGPKGDWEERVRSLVETCDFDLDNFAGSGETASESTSWTLWQVRRR